MRILPNPSYPSIVLNTVVRLISVTGNRNPVIEDEIHSRYLISIQYTKDFRTLRSRTKHLDFLVHLPTKYGFNPPSNPRRSGNLQRPFNHPIYPEMQHCSSTQLPLLHIRSARCVFVAITPIFSCPQRENPNKSRMEDQIK